MPARYSRQLGEWVRDRGIHVHDTTWSEFSYPILFGTMLSFRSALFFLVCSFFLGCALELSFEGCRSSQLASRVGGIELSSYA